MPRRWECEATLDRGDHGMGATRGAAQRTGLIEVTGTTLRWVPREGLEWTLPLSELAVTPPGPWPRHGVEVRHADVGTFRIRPVGGPMRARALVRRLTRPRA
ncbi:hypothetical protein [Demequina sp. NBRC 110056]|uniref:hypothetical protein n=1 Tax=Demequina sp. NBRC 110056 TaxID=1570345 RepID=UPI000A06E9A4|nr:hypothetical protein [Demequina sp. NBRC 110056]